MKPKFHDPLEREISRELQTLPDLEAPASLTTRVMAAIEKRAANPWYHQSWEFWPRTAQAASFVVLLAAFGGFCFGGWLLVHTDVAAIAFNRAGNCVLKLGALGNTLQVLGSSAVLVVKNLGTGFMIAGVSMMALAYFLCIGLGTVCVRLAYARR